MSTTWGEFIDGVLPEIYNLLIETGSAGVKVQINNIKTGECLKFWLKDEDIDDCIMALELAKSHTLGKGGK